MNDIEHGTCDVCKKECDLIRTYFHYDIKCECHSPKHFELVCHCSDCKAIEPERTRIELKINPVCSNGKCKPTIVKLMIKTDTLKKQLE